jgi:hypothetical protein
VARGVGNERADHPDASSGHPPPSTQPLKHHRGNLPFSLAALFLTEFVASPTFNVLTHHEVETPHTLGQPGVAVD